MDFVYVTAFKVLGLVHEPEAPDIVLYSGLEPTIKATVTGDLSSHLGFIDRQLALASMLLKGMVGDPIPDEFQTNLQAQMESIRQERARALAGVGAVVIEIRGPLQGDVSDPLRRIDDYILCFDAFDKKALSASLQSQVSAVLSAMRMGANHEYRFENIVSGSYAVGEDGKIVHLLSFEGGQADIYVSKPLSAEQVSEVAEDINLVRRARSLERVVRLYTHSLDRKTDRFRAFVSAWSALEILVAKIFPVYQGKLEAELAAVSGAPGLRSYLDRIAVIMKDKHSITDKFAVVSMYLDRRQNPDEVEVFRQLKKTRDLLSHGEDVPDNDLPTEDVQGMFEKYLKSHLRNGT
jgi:hypothetical protein